MSPARSQRGLHVVLLAGGSGTRFWPLSRRERPKQFLALSGTRPLLEETWRRVRRLAPRERTWVVAPSALARSVRGALPDLQRGRLVLEPSPRDTAPAVGLACAAVSAVDPEATVAIFPTDHVIQDAAELARSVRVAARAAAQGSLVCLGIRPDRPATGFGYLKCAAKPVRGRATAVERFVEKPDERRAKRFLRAGCYLWNAGMFVWRVDSFLEELSRTAPSIHRAVLACAGGNRRAWTRASRLSVDYAVMERARNVRVVPLQAGWDDVGSWDAASRLREAAARPDRSKISVESPGSVVFGSTGRFVALVDVPGITVVDTPDALLVVSRRSSEKVKAVVEDLRRRGRKDLL